ncbi:MAG: metal-dependent hydrolase [Pirellulaceae bacterium]
MADSRTHFLVSSLAGVALGYAGWKSGLPWETCCIGGGLCAVAGMLPDLDSPSGKPLRELSLLGATIVPMLLTQRLDRLGLGADRKLLVAVAIYLLVRLGILEIFRRFSVHRGMWHSIPALGIVGLLGYWLSESEIPKRQVFVATALMLGFLSHLLLDEVWSIDFQGGRYRYKNTFGTALKLWGKDGSINLLVYGLLGLLAWIVSSDMKRQVDAAPEQKDQQPYGEIVPDHQPSSSDRLLPPEQRESDALLPGEPDSGLDSR